MNIDLIGVPLDFGAGRRGVDMGPSAIRYAGLRQGLEALNHQVFDLGNIPVPVAETCVPGDPHLKYLDPIVEVAQRLATAVETSIADGHVPLVLGGDHALSLGSVAGAARQRKLGLIWFDAHGDFNTADTTPSGNIHGMPLAALLGFGDERLTTLKGVQPGGPKLEQQKRRAGRHPRPGPCRAPPAGEHRRPCVLDGGGGPLGHLRHDGAGDCAGHRRHRRRVAEPRP